MEEEPLALLDIGELEQAEAELEEEPAHPPNPLDAPLFDPFDESTWELFLLAWIEGEDIFLYGGEEPGTLMLYYNGQRNHFGHWPWWGPRHDLPDRIVLPQMIYRDLTGDGVKELALSLPVSNWAGISLNNLCVLTIERDEVSGGYSFTEHVLRAGEVRQWMTIPIHGELSGDRQSFRIDFAGQSFIFDDNDDWRIFGGNDPGELIELYFGNVVIFHFLDDRIGVHIGIGPLFENPPIPGTFTAIYATVVFDGEGFTLTDYWIDLPCCNIH